VRNQRFDARGEGVRKKRGRNGSRVENDLGFGTNTLIYSRDT
jgi:hypothetical protein